jgi:hypothetical protein
MELKKSIVYIDAFGNQHDALVIAINQMHEGVISVAYVGDGGRFGAEPLKFAFDIQHMSARSEMTTVQVSDKENPAHLAAFPDGVKQGNPKLPTYHLNCWKEPDEEHKALPSDHPAFDHPYDFPKADEHGYFPVKSRPEFEADQVAHLRMGAATESLPSGADLDAVDAEEETKRATTPVQSQVPDYGDLRKQLNDYSSTFYGPHGCDVCSGTVIRRALEQGGEMYEERDPNLGPPRYAPHLHKSPSKIKEADVATQLDRAGDAPLGAQGEADPPVQ